MLGGLEHAHGVHEPVGALLRHHVLQIGIGLKHDEVVTSIVGGHSGVAGLHFLEHLVHDLALINTGTHSVCNQLIGLLNLLLIRGVHGIAQVHQGDAKCVPGVVDQQHVAGVGRIEHGVPTCDGAVDHAGIVDDAKCAPGIRNGVLVLRIIGQILEPRVDLFKIGNIIVIEFGQHVLFNQLRDHIIGGDNHVVIHAAHTELRIEGLIALCGDIIDSDSGFFLKLVDQGFIDVFTPAAHVDDAFLRVSTAAPAQGQGGHHHGKRQGKCLFQLIIPPVLI